MSSKISKFIEKMEIELSDRFERVVPYNINVDEHLVWQGRNFSADCLIEIGNVRYLLRFEKGIIKKCLRGLPIMSAWDFALRGSVRAWDALWQDPPKPGWHDLFALTKRGEMTIEGNLHPLMSNLQYFKDVIIFPRKGVQFEKKYT